MLSETSAALVDIVEHPTKVPTATKAKKAKNEFRIFIFSPFDATSVNLPFRYETDQTSLTEYSNGVPANLQSGPEVEPGHVERAKCFSGLPSITGIAPTTAAK